MLENIFIGIQIILGLSIIIVVLMQKSSSFGIGIYAEESLGKMKGIQKITLFLIFLFICNSLFIGNLITPSTENISIFTTN